MRPHFSDFLERFLATSVLTLVLTGCASLAPEPRVDLGVKLPDHWDALETQSAPLVFEDPWWIQFDDATLTNLVQEAIESNWDLKAAGARVDAARARAIIQGADLKPSVGFGFDGRRARQNFLNLPLPGGADDVLSNTSSTLGVSLNVSWEIDLWGRLRSARSAADADYMAAEADLAAAGLSITGQLAKTYFAVLEAREQVAIATSNWKNREDTARRVQHRYNLGVRSPLDLRLAKTNVDLSLATVETWRAVQDRLERQLAVLLGRYPIRVMDGALKVPSPPPTLPSGLPSELVRRRPDLAAVEQRLQAAGHRVGEARAMLYPRLTLTGSGGRSSEELDDLLDGDFSVWNIAAGILQPVFQGGRLRAGVTLSEANMEEATAIYAADLLVAFAEVESSLAAERILDDRVTALASAVENARAAKTLAQDRYEAGVSDFLNVLESQRQTFQAESLLADAKRRRLDARVDLILALGGGYALEEQAPKKDEG